jgi:hypothetical protein
MTANKKLSNSSSRAGRFKKRLVGPEALQKEAPILHQRISLLRTWLESNEISDKEFVALSIIATLSYRFPNSWPGARRSALLETSSLTFPMTRVPWEIESNVRQRLAGFPTIGEVFNHFSLRSVPLSVNRSILSWGQGNYKLRLFFHIPKPQEVLAQQVLGERCVTVLAKESEISKYILGERDHLGFTLHDLIHADHFFHENQHHRGQINFYRLLQNGLGKGAFLKALEDENFEREFEYLISDMNAYPVHLMKCLKAALIHYSKDSKNYFLDWLKGNHFSVELEDALKNLNTPAYDALREDDIILKGLEIS